MIEEETFEKLATVGCVGDLGMELDAEFEFGKVFHCGDGAGVRVGGDDESGWDVGDLIAVGHPDGIDLDFFDEGAVDAGAKGSAPVFAFGGFFDGAAHVFRHELLTVADAEGGDAFKEIEIEGGSIFGKGGFGAAGKDNGIGFAGFEMFPSGLPRDHFAVAAEFAHTPDDELGVLPAKVDYGYELMLHRKIGVWLIAVIS